MSTYSSGESNTPPSRDRDTHSIDNAMYDRIVEGNGNDSSTEEVRTQIVKPLIRERAATKEEVVVLRHYIYENKRWCWWVQSGQATGAPPPSADEA